MKAMVKYNDRTSDEVEFDRYENKDFYIVFFMNGVPQLLAWHTQIKCIDMRF